MIGWPQSFKTKGEQSSRLSRSCKTLYAADLRHKRTSSRASLQVWSSTSRFSLWVCEHACKYIIIKSFCVQVVVRFLNFLNTQRAHNTLQIYGTSAQVLEHHCMCKQACLGFRFEFLNVHAYTSLYHIFLRAVCCQVFEFLEHSTCTQYATDLRHMRTSCRASLHVWAEVVRAGCSKLTVSLEEIDDREHFRR